MQNSVDLIRNNFVCIFFFHYVYLIIFSVIIMQSCKPYVVFKFYFLYYSSRWCHHRKLGLQSLPVAFGVDNAKYITVGTIDITQFAVAAYLFYIGETTYALVTSVLLTCSQILAVGFHLYLLEPYWSQVNTKLANIPSSKKKHLYVCYDRYCSV